MSIIVQLPNFSWSELEQSGGTVQKIPPNLKGNAERLAICLQALRFRWDRPIKITSGYRTPEHNAKIGGVPNSLHTQALAVDCVSENLEAFKQFCDRWWPGGVGIYAGHVHLDLGAFRRWRM